MYANRIFSELVNSLQSLYIATTLDFTFHHEFLYVCETNEVVKLMLAWVTGRPLQVINMSQSVITIEICNV